MCGAIVIDHTGASTSLVGMVKMIDHENVIAAPSHALRELDPTYFFPVMTQGWIDMEAGKLPSAIASFKKATTMGAPPFVYAYLGYVYGVSGDRKNAMAQLDTLKRLAAGGSVLPFNLALVHLGLGRGDKQQAMTELEAARAADSQMLAWVGQDAMFDPLRSEPRFQSLLRRLHFAD